MVFIYVLQLYSNKYYVGKTSNPKFRLESHFNSTGSVWTKKYKPIKVIELIPNCDDFDEDKYTVKYMKDFGIDNVRGGTFCQLKLTTDNRNTIEKMINGSTNKCYKCGKIGHFARVCKKKPEEYVDKKSAFIEYKKEFIMECKAIDNSCMLLASDILTVFQIIDHTLEMKLTHIYGLCQTINSCEFLKYIPEYRGKINCNDFIDGFIYICINDPQICDECSQEECYCEKPKSSCTKCGRKGHTSNKCYAKKTIRGKYIEADSNEEDSDGECVWMCSYCDKTFDTEKGATFHENRYCTKNKKVSKPKYRYYNRT